MLISSVTTLHYVSRMKVHKCCSALAVQSQKVNTQTLVSHAGELLLHLCLKQLTA